MFFSLSSSCSSFLWSTHVYKSSKWVQKQINQNIVTVQLHLLTLLVKWLSVSFDGFCLNDGGASSNNIRSSSIFSNSGSCISVYQEHMKVSYIASSVLTIEDTFCDMYQFSRDRKHIREAIITIATIYIARSRRYWS